VLQIGFFTGEWYSPHQIKRHKFKVQAPAPKGTATPPQKNDVHATVYGGTTLFASCNLHTPVPGSHLRQLSCVECGLLQVMPKDPCTGVENWNQKKPGMMCPGEAIWTEAQRVIDAAKLPDDYAWGAAINPVSRRGQHQVQLLTEGFH
jgi:hypothetical protein